MSTSNEIIQQLILNTDPTKFPDYDTFAAFSYIFKFLSEPEGVSEPESDPKQVIYPLLKIKDDDTTYKNLNQKYGGENENRTFKEELIRSFNSYDIWHNINNLFNTDVNSFDFNDESTNKELTSEANKNYDLRIGCNPALKNDKISKDKIVTYNTLFNKDVKISDFIKIHPDIVQAVDKLFHTQAWDIKLDDVPIYFVIKNNKEEINSHVSSYIYYKGLFYSFGVGGGIMGNAVIFPIDPLLFFNNNNLQEYLDIIYTTNNLLSNDKTLVKQFKSMPDSSEKIQLKSNIENFRSQIISMENALKSMPFVGIKIIDMGVLTQFHIDNINDIINNIEKINVDLCITKISDSEKLRCTMITMPIIKLSNSFASVKGNIIESIKDTRDINIRKLNKRINCVYSMDYVFQDTLKCDKYGVITPGNCRKITIDDENGGYKENPIKYENIKLMFDLLIKAKKGEPVQYIEFAAVSQASYTTINRSFFKNRQKCINMVDDVNLKKFIGQMLPSNGVDLSTYKAFKGGWIEGQDDKGSTYYYNIMTGESKWELPKEATPIPNIQNIDLPNNIDKEQCTNLFKEFYTQANDPSSKITQTPQSGFERFSNFFYNLMPTIPNIGLTYYPDDDDDDDELSFGRLGGGKNKMNKKSRRTMNRRNKSRKAKFL